MLTLAEVAELNTLWRKYGTRKHQLNLLELYGLVRRETKLAETGTIRVTRDLLRELRADRNRVSYLVRKEIGRGQLRNPWQPFGNYAEWMLNL